MTKEDIYSYLSCHGVRYEVTNHKPLFSMSEAPDVDLPYPECDAKNLFVRDDKRKGYYLITVKGAKRVDLKEFRKAYGLRPLTFASAEDLDAMMHLKPGSVTPLGLLEDSASKITLYLDEEFGSGLIGIHPCDNTSTVWIKAPELVRILAERGIEVRIVRLPVR